MILISPPLFFFLSVLFFFSTLPSSAFSQHCRRTVKTRDVAAAHQHAVDLDSCVPVPSPFSLCDAISDYIVINNGLGVCSQPSLSRTWAKLFREHCFQVQIYRGVKCFLILWHRLDLPVLRSDLNQNEVKILLFFL